MTEIPTAGVDLRDVDPDLRDHGAAFEFRLCKQRFAQTFQRLDLVGRQRSWYLDNLLLAIAVAGPDHAVDVAEQAGYHFVSGPTFESIGRGRIEVSGRLAPDNVLAIPEPATPVALS